MVFQWIGQRVDFIQEAAAALRSWRIWDPPLWRPKTPIQSVRWPRQILLLHRATVRGRGQALQGCHICVHGVHRPPHIHLHQHKRTEGPPLSSRLGYGGGLFSHPTPPGPKRPRLQKVSNQPLFWDKSRRYSYSKRELIGTEVKVFYFTYFLEDFFIQFSKAKVV